MQSQNQGDREMKFKDVSIMIQTQRKPTVAMTCCRRTKSKFAGSHNFQQAVEENSDSENLIQE